MRSNVTILINGERHSVEVLEIGRDCARFNVAGRTYEVRHEYHLPENTSSPTQTTSRATLRPSKKGRAGEIVAPIPGVISEVLVQVGKVVQGGEILLKLEAMKMQNSIVASSTGTIREIHVAVGDEVGDGQLLVTLE